MSKTDKTKPWRVRMAEHRPLFEVHNHVSGECTLPSSPLDPVPIKNGCHYAARVLCYPGSCCWGCGCRMCTDYYARKMKRRRERREAKGELRNGDYE